MTAENVPDATITAELRAQLHTVGLRATRPRLAILGWLRNHPHATQTRRRGRCAGNSARCPRRPSTTCCTRAPSQDCSAASKAGHPALFETRTADNHHHLVCRGCGRTEDVDCVEGLAPCLDPSGTAGYEVDEAEVVFWDRCPDCRSEPDGQLVTAPAVARRAAAGAGHVDHRHEEGRP